MNRSKIEIRVAYWASKYVEKCRHSEDWSYSIEIQWWTGFGGRKGGNHKNPELFLAVIIKWIVGNASIHSSSDHKKKSWRRIGGISRNVDFRCVNLRQLGHLGGIYQWF